jgi:hypothetical protein
MQSIRNKDGLYITDAVLEMAGVDRAEISEGRGYPKYMPQENVIQIFEMANRVLSEEKLLLAAKLRCAEAEAERDILNLKALATWNTDEEEVIYTPVQ